MLKISFEFRKGIFFLRLIGDLDRKSYLANENEINELLNNNKFKYVVINMNYIKKIDFDGLNYMTKIYYMTKENESNLVICDKFNIFSRLLNNNVPNIKNELEVL